MSLQDEVRAVSKSKEEVQSEQYQKDYEAGVLSAEYCIKGIKEKILEKAKNGEYDKDLKGENYIQFFYSGSMRAGIDYDMGLEPKIEDCSVDGKVYTTYTFVKYEIVNPGKYQGFLHRIFEFSAEENVSFKITCHCDLYGTKYEFNPVVGHRFKGSVARHNLTCGIYCNLKY